ncbi:MAG: hypothetical protein FH762_01400 [Firmicutes bacterium]|nr:hypothetical protein [Bacillota bacterium]
MINISKNKYGVNIEITAIPMGDDWNVSITGGERAHIGAVALAIPQMQGEIDVKVLTVEGHKEDQIVSFAAERLAAHFNVQIVVSCGIHRDNISKKDILNFIKIVKEGLSELINTIENEM